MADCITTERKKPVIICYAGRARRLVDQAANAGKKEKGPVRSSSYKNRNITVIQKVYSPQNNEHMKYYIFLILLFECLLQGAQNDTL